MKKYIIACILFACTMLCGCGDKRASDYNKEGQAYYDNGDYVRAEECLQKAREMEPSNLSFKQNHAMIMVQTGRVDEAIALLGETVSTNEDEDSKRLNKFAYRGMGIASLEAKAYANAITFFDRALSIEVSTDWDNDIKYYKADASRSMGDNAGAKMLLTEIVASDVQNPKVFRTLADIYREEGDYRSAIENYRNVLKFDKGDFETYIGLAASYAALGEQKNADEALFQASLLEIKSDKDKYYLGVIHFYMKEYNSAKPEMEYALANGINEAYFYLAELEMITGSPEKAVKYFEKYCETVEVQSPTVCNDMAVCSINKKDYEKAYEWIEKGLSYPASGSQQELKRNEVACLEGMGKLDEATKKLKEYLIDYPEDEAAKTDYAFLSMRTGTAS